MKTFWGQNDHVGGIKVNGTDLLGSTGKLTVSLLPIATTSVVGAVRVGTGLSVVASTGVLSVGNHSATLLTSGTVPAARLPLATASAVGGVKVGTGLAVASGVISVSNHSASLLTSGTVPAARLPLATTSTAGAIKVGEGLSITNGVLSATGGSGGTSPSFTLLTEEEDSLSSSCTDAQVPSARLVYTHIQDSCMKYSDGVLTILMSTSDSECYPRISSVRNYTKSAPQTLIQGIKILTSGVIALEDNVVIYKRALTAATTFSIDTSEVLSNINYVLRYNQNSTKVITFELVLEMPATVYAVTFPSSVSWLNGETPTLTTASTTYILVFRSFDGGTSWVGNLQGSF